MKFLQKNMASINSRSWILQELMAHNSKVNCLSLGRKSGRVMVTGGDDKKVNLWAIGKSSCFMSLSGHTTPIECVQFNQLEELVCAGSQAGALKIWDLEAAKLVRTLNGHSNKIKAIDFHPYADFLASGSADNSIKLWDTRKKSAITTYNGHKGSVNSVKFSPDAQWIATGSEDGSVRIWDVRVGRVLKEFVDHQSAVTCVEFHPHEFLLATGSTDRSVNFFDLENFNLVSSETSLGIVQSLCFNPDGECLFTGVKDFLKVVGWEPSRLYDTVPVKWGTVGDISTAQNQLVGASFNLTNVHVYVVDLKRVRPLGQNTLDESPCAFTPNQSIRKSFSKAERPVSLKNRSLDVKTIEESTSGTDPEEESCADIVNRVDYEEIFKGKGLRRTPPPEPEPFQEPVKEPPQYLFRFAEKIVDPAAPQILGEITSDSFEALSLDNNINNYHKSPPPASSPAQYSRSKSNLDQVYASKLTKENILPNINRTGRTVAPRYNLQRQSSCKDVPEKDKIPTRSNNMRHSVSEDTNVNKGSMSSRVSLRKNSITSSRPVRTSVPNLTKVPPPNSARTNRIDRVKLNLITNGDQVDIYLPSKISPEERPPKEESYVPVSIDKPVGIIFDDFLPKNHQAMMGFQHQLPDMSEAEVLNVVMRGHEPIMGILAARQRSLKIVLAQSRTKDLKAAVETAIAMDDLSVLVDVLGVINSKNSLWSLDLCVHVLTKMEELLQSKYETYMTTGCNSLRIILTNFGNMIKTNMKCSAGSFGVDIPREERYRKCKKCHESLCLVRPVVMKKTSLPGALGGTFREINTILQDVMDV
ncbi:unnamed protein product [Brassicogethes aeneus]|uniref:Katanin p80 WD40 repeat-containing subunit B1 n=1 Tax=Brassicogethes aeneus TaxID=1431903 RepID=A0A9P0B7Z7_BRAAE|nr:unnamed protein product [Brassicogethes aeneus]